MANSQGEPIPFPSAPPRYEDISIHGPRDAFIPSHSPPPPYDFGEVQGGAAGGNQMTRGRRSDPTAPLLDSTDAMVITFARQGYRDPGDGLDTSETSRLIGRGSRTAASYGIGRSRRYGSVDNPLFEELLRRHSSTNSVIKAMLVLNFLASIGLFVVGIESVLLPTSLTLYFGGVVIACGVLFFVSSMVVNCRFSSHGASRIKLASFGSKLTNFCAIISCLMLAACAFSVAQETTYIFTCNERQTALDATVGSQTPKLKCPDGIINPPLIFEDLMLRVIFQGVGCLLFLTLSITLSVQMCHMTRFVMYRRALNNIE